MPSLLKKTPLASCMGMILLLVALVAVHPAAAKFDLSQPEDCRDTCVGWFGFETLTQVEECCALTRGFYENNEFPLENITDTGTQEKGIGCKSCTLTNCRSHGGDKHSRIIITYGFNEGETCDACYGSIREADECGVEPPTSAPTSGSRSNVKDAIVTCCAAAVVLFSLTVNKLW
jgi:hypothetical protein